MIGESLLHYRITGTLGAGGMGEVYRATDTKLDREVAIKVLPEQMTRDPERVARFQREARTLASLNHPNIAGLFGFESDRGRNFLVMELVEGETLAERLERGPIALEESLDIARQIADGLEEAHEKGIVHRDLKPANIKLTPDDKVKILDFGLARAYQGDGVEESSIEHSPTITAAMTQQGVILGTAAYMSPEQARGKTVDRRADLWSFGVVLWEMLTGERLFSGETTSDTLAAVLREEPPYDDLPPDTPEAVRRMLERCLERDPRKRLRDIGEARVRLERWRDDPSSLSGILTAPETHDARAAFRRAVPWLVATLAVAAAVWAWFGPQPSSSPMTTSPVAPLAVEVELAHESTLQMDIATNVIVSPDGTTLAYIADGGIWIRPLDSLEPVRLSGSEGANMAAFSPNGRWIAFNANGRLMRTSVTGGAPFELCEVDDPRGMDWVDDSTVVYSPGITGGLWVVSIDDGETRPITELDESRSERSHRWPRRLPDGKSVVYLNQFFGSDYDQGDIQVVSIETGERRTIYRGGAAPRILPQGYLLFARASTLFAAVYDFARGEIRGNAVPVLEDVWTSLGDQESCDGSAQFDVSDTGSLVYRKGSGALVTESRLSFLDFGSGRAEAVLSEPDGYATPLLSPDGAYLAYCVERDDSRNIFILETETGLSRQLTFDEESSWLGCWGPDSTTLYWSRSSQSSRHRFFRQRVDGSTPEEMFYEAEQTAYPTGVSPDGSTLLYSVWAGPDTWDVREMTLGEPEAGSRPVLEGAGMQFLARFSPDGRWLSYLEGFGPNNVAYITPYPPTGAQWEVSGENVESVWWLGETGEIWYRDGTAFSKRSLSAAANAIRLGRPEIVLPESYVRSAAWWAAMVTGDGRGAYVLDPIGDQTANSAVRIILETQWVKRRVERALASNADAVGR